MSGKHYIPMKFEGLSTDEGRRVFESAGIKFVRPFLDRFYEVILPKDLSIVNFGPRLKVIIDSLGNQRAGILAGVQPNEETSIQLFQRYCVTFDVITKERHQYVVGMVFNGNKIEFESEHIPFPNLPSARKKMVEHAIGLAIQWVETFYPEWKNPAAYW